MKAVQLLTRLHWKWRLPLRLRLALWSSGLVMILSFGLVVFINVETEMTFPKINGKITLLNDDSKQLKQLQFPANIPVPSLQGTSKKIVFGVPGTPPDTMKVIQEIILFQLRSISLVGLVLVAVLGGGGAYLLSGIALRPVRRVSGTARNIEASTLATRLALVGPRDEVKELADTFDAMLARLERSFEQQRNFVSDAAHELRTPLTLLRTNLEVTLAHPDIPSADFRALALSQERALTRLESLVNDLLLLTKAEQAPILDEVPLEALVEEVLLDLQPVAEARQVTLCPLEGVGVVVQGDDVLLARVFNNLVENAIYYNHPGGTVTVCIDRKDAWAMITVSDTGIGISPDKQAHIFDRFYRVDGSRTRNKGGAGLGLSIVNAIVQQHGGLVQVESSPGVGSVFMVLLPVLIGNSDFRFCKRQEEEVSSTFC
ncbi:MAG: ATP-binding protein [Chloroflexota bacterium]|nr:ATP-binding protein [Chloroflexota bacterium]